MESRRQQMGHGEALKAGQKQKPATYPGSDSSFSSSFAAHAGTSTSTRRTQLSEFYPLKCCRHPESSMIFSCSRSRSRSCCSRFFLTTTLAFAIALHSNSHSNTVQAMRAQESILHLLDLSGSLHSASSSSSSEAADASLKMQHALAMQLEHRQARGQQSKKLVLDPDTPQPSKDAHPRPSLQVVLEPMANAAASAVSIAALVGSGVGSSSSSSSSSRRGSPNLTKVVGRGCALEGHARDGWGAHAARRTARGGWLQHGRRHAGIISWAGTRGGRASKASAAAAAAAVEVLLPADSRWLLRTNSKRPLPSMLLAAPAALPLQLQPLSQEAAPLQVLLRHQSPTG
mmetsp:Transcript_31949/g.67999  ORF Transcript_31949/g.67999 Transcript_31949/m.67999 type:complete len:344 (+) Transcript_31949:84-1115(+)